MSHFASTEQGIEVSLTPEERLFLADIIPFLAGVGEVGKDPAATRLNVPVYLDDPEANDEWWLLMGSELDMSRKADRAVFAKVVDASDDAMLSIEEAEAFLRVINEARLGLAARFGLDVEEDHGRLPDDRRQVLDYLGWVLEELAVELSRGL